VIDDNAAIHEDLRKILCPPEPESAGLQDSETVLILIM